MSERGLIFELAVARSARRSRGSGTCAGRRPRRASTSGMSIDRAALLAAGERRRRRRRSRAARRRRPPSPTARSSARRRSARAGARRARAAADGSARFTPGPPSTARSSPCAGREALGHAAREVHQRAPVAGQRVDRDPLVGAVMAAAGGAELDRRARPAFWKATASEAPSRPTLIDSPSVSREAAWQSASTYGLRRRHARGRPDERARDVDVRDRADLGEQLARVLLREIADVDVHGAFLGHLVRRVASDDPPEVHRRADRRAPRTQG